MADLHATSVSSQVTAGRRFGIAPDDADLGRPLAEIQGAALPPLPKSGAVQRFAAAMGIVLAVALAPAGESIASTHESSHDVAKWPRASASLRQSGLPVAEIVHAARQDLAERGADPAASSLEFARWLQATMSEPEIDLEAERGVEILRTFMSQPDRNVTDFWSEFSLAAFQQIAGDNLAVADTLGRALELAASEDVPSEIVARTRGIMGHAQQAGGRLEQARQTFEFLEGNPAERVHATVHLGEIALFTGGIGASLDIWLNHPDGMAAGVAVVADEADALWRPNPGRSYRLVVEALARIDRRPATAPSAELETAIARLKARTRENAILP